MQLVGFEDAKKILVKYKIPFPRTDFILSKKELFKAVKGFRYPLFLKIYGKNIFERTDIGGVGEAKDRRELENMFSRMIKIKGAEGVLVQEKVDGKSLIVGMRNDPQFGPVIIVGIGGIFAEILKDFVLRVAPVSEKEALKMLEELKGYDYLCGKRDKKSINFKAVAKIIVALSDLGFEEKEIKDVTLNPIISNDKIASAVDFKFLT